MVPLSKNKQRKKIGKQKIKMEQVAAVVKTVNQSKDSWSNPPKIHSSISLKYQNWDWDQGWDQG